jgi:hypothetical protein
MVGWLFGPLVLWSFASSGRRTVGLNHPDLVCMPRWLLSIIVPCFLPCFAHKLASRMELLRYRVFFWGHSCPGATLLEGGLQIHRGVRQDHLPGDSPAIFPGRGSGTVGKRTRNIRTALRQNHSQRDAKAVCPGWPSGGQNHNPL